MSSEPCVLTVPCAVCQEEDEDQHPSASEEEEEEDTELDEETLLMVTLGLPVAFSSSSLQSRAVRLHLELSYCVSMCVYVMC